LHAQHLLARLHELGLATFADLAAGVSPQQRMRELMEEVELADSSASTSSPSASTTARTS
jgi:hypothetical protein